MTLTGVIPVLAAVFVGCAQGRRSYPAGRKASSRLPDFAKPRLMTYAAPMAVPRRHTRKRLSDVSLLLPCQRSLTQLLKIFCRGIDEVRREGLAFEHVHHRA